MYFQQTVLGSFVKVSFKGTYHVAEIVDIKEEGVPYDLGKVKTNIQLSLKFGNSKKWFKIFLISNREPSQDEFEKLMQARRAAQDFTPLTLEKVKVKQMEI